MIGKEIHTKAFRDTKDFYLEVKPQSVVSPRLMGFAKKHAGQRILDLGCGTGGYAQALNQAGYRCTGIDVNDAYLAVAASLGVEVYPYTSPLPFADGAFETTLLFEVLEHVDDPAALLAEAKRVSRKNVLVTVPACDHTGELMGAGVIYEHFLEKDHINFFTQRSLEAAMRPHFTSVSITTGDELAPHRLFGKGVVRYALTALYKMQMLRALPTRLYAVGAV